MGGTMNLSFLVSNVFVLTWFISGLLLALWVIYDVLYVNTAVSTPLKVGWPIILSFFSILGLFLYIVTCRAPRTAYLRAIEKKKAHHAYVGTTFDAVTGSVVHCVAGDALGIVIAMSFSRYLGLGLWWEITAEYLLGFVLGWLLFQYPAMKSMGNDSVRLTLWKAGRAEFFSMITLMTGMILILRFVAPRLVSSPPMPTTAAFWGIAFFALLIGSLLTYPMNWWLVSIRWKHGMS
jgi:hypothetical protein